VIDHAAKPRIAAGWDREWGDRMAPFRDLPNVHCKLSGLVTEADGARLRVADLNRYVHAVLDWFGEDRVIFGSDWPVCLLAASYDRVLAALRETLADLSPAARRKLLADNAIRFYRLEM
jgi:L-fuconolactonase